MDLEVYSGFISAFITLAITGSILGSGAVLPWIFCRWLIARTKYYKLKIKQIENGLNTKNGVDINNPTGK